MFSTQGDSWVEEANLNGECFILVQGVVSVVPSLLKTSRYTSRLVIALHCCQHECISLHTLYKSDCGLNIIHGYVESR
jgi:hypothetical protein